MQIETQRKFSKVKALQALLLANFMIATAAYCAPVRKPVPHVTASAPSPAYDVAVCKKLANDYENASKSLALNNALTKDARSASRVSQLASEDNTTVSSASMTLGLIRDNHCPSPTFTPSAGRYAVESMACSVALTKQREAVSFYHLQRTMGQSAQLPSSDFPKECEISSWTPPAS